MQTLFLSSWWTSLLSCCLSRLLLIFFPSQYIQSLSLSRLQQYVLSFSQPAQPHGLYWKPGGKYEEWCTKSFEEQEPTVQLEVLLGVRRSQAQPETEVPLACAIHTGLLFSWFPSYLTNIGRNEVGLWSCSLLFQFLNAQTQPKKAQYLHFIPQSPPQNASALKCELCNYTVRPPSWCYYIQNFNQPRIKTFGVEGTVYWYLSVVFGNAVSV